VLRGTWCTPDIQEAVRQGYLLVKIHDIWHFPKTHRRTGLFAYYVNAWLQIKQQFPGYPACASTPEQQQQDVTDYEIKENIALISL